MSPTQEQIDAAASAIHAANRNNSGLTFSDLVRKMAEAALVAAAQVAPFPYLIWSNERRAWWRPNSCGYTVELEAAGRYSRAEAISIAANARDGWRNGEPPPEIALPERDALEALATARRPG